MTLLFVVYFTSVFIFTSCEFFHHNPYDYCDPTLKLCDIPKSHTMCRFPIPGLAPDCAPEINAPLTDSEKEGILHLHNSLRNSVARGGEKKGFGFFPSASNMQQMFWDFELEEIAKRWAEQCRTEEISVHDECRNIRRFNVTQNIGTITWKGEKPEKQVSLVFYLWRNKKEYFKLEDISKYSEKKDAEIDEFTNLIWANTRAIGCSRVWFARNVTEETGNTLTWTYERLVCNYGPGVNKFENVIYKRGIPCSDCPKGSKRSTQFSALCSYEMNNEEERSNDVQLPVVLTNVKLKTGILINGICHCSDVVRYADQKSSEFTAEEMKTTNNKPIEALLLNEGFHSSNQSGRCFCGLNGGRASSSPYPLALSLFLSINIFLICNK